MKDSEVDAENKEKKKKAGKLVVKKDKTMMRFKRQSIPM